MATGLKVGGDVEQALENVGVPSYVLDKTGIVRWINPAAERLSWHSLRHSYASKLATDLELPATTLARLTGHTDAGFTLRVYARDGRNDATVVEDVLARAAGAGIGA